MSYAVERNPTGEEGRKKLDLNLTWGSPSVASICRSVCFLTGSLDSFSTGRLWVLGPGPVRQGGGGMQTWEKTRERREARGCGGDGTSWGEPGGGIETER